MQSELEVKFKLEGVLVMSGNKVPKVWIDQDLCTGDGLCAEICPGVFVAGGMSKNLVLKQNLERVVLTRRS